MAANTSKKQVAHSADMERLIQLVQQVSELAKAPLQEQVLVKSPLGGYELQLRDVHVRSTR